MLGFGGEKIRMWMWMWMMISGRGGEQEVGEVG